MEELKREGVVADVSDETMKKSKQKKAKSKKVFGTVIDCFSLYVRSGPGYEYDTLGSISRDTKIEIADDSIPDWYGVITSDGVRGFCMSKYISIKA